MKESNLDELLPLVRDYCDFYEVNPPDERLRYLSLILIKNPPKALSCWHATATAK